MKFTLADIHEALQKANVSPDKIDAAAQILQQIAEENKPEDDEKQKRLKKTIIGFVAKNPSVADQTENQIWLVQANQGVNHTDVLPILKSASAQYNESIQGKKKKNKIQKIAEIFSVLKPKFIKDKGLKVLNKEPIILVSFDNSSI